MLKIVITCKKKNKRLFPLAYFSSTVDAKLNANKYLQTYKYMLKLLCEIHFQYIQIQQSVTLTEQSDKSSL